MANFGEWLKSERLRRGLTLEELAARSPVKTTPATISRFENELRRVTPESVEYLAAALAGPDADPGEVESLYWEAWGSLGSRRGEQVKIIPADDSRIQLLDAFDDLELEVQPAMLEAIKAAGAAKRSQRTDIVGKRPVED